MLLLRSNEIEAISKTEQEAINIPNLFMLSRPQPCNPVLL